MIENWAGSPLPEKVRKYAAEGRLLQEKQIGNLSEIVQYMLDNWSGTKPNIELRWKYPTESEVALTTPILENASEIIAAMYAEYETAFAETVIAQAGEAIVIDDAEKSVKLTGTTNQQASIKAKSVALSDFTAELDFSTGVGIAIDAQTVTIDDSSVTGATQMKNTQLVKVTGAEELTFKDVTFTGPTYNTIMTGQTTETFLKKMLIDGCAFDEECKHVNVWFAGYQDGGVLTIKDTSFKTCEQFLCVSDFSGTTNKVTINLENIDIAAYQNADNEDKEYNGIILFDDRYCANEEAFLEAAPFGPDKVTLNITNVTAGGVKLTAENLNIGSAEVGQMIYLYCKKSGKTYRYSTETAYLFPKIYVDGVEVVPPAAE